MTPRLNSVTGVPASPIVHLCALALRPAQARCLGSPWPAAFPPRPPLPFSSQLCSGASQVLCSGSTPGWRACPDYAFGFPDRSGASSRRMPARSLGSRACSFSTCVRLCDYAGPDGSSRFALPPVWPSLGSTWSAPGLRFSKLNSSPVDASVYTSPGTSRHPAQDSRSRWFAIPFLWSSFIPDCTPVYPDAFTPSRSRLSTQFSAY